MENVKIGLLSSWRELYSPRVSKSTIFLTTCQASNGLVQKFMLKPGGRHSALYLFTEESIAVIGQPPVKHIPERTRHYPENLK